jgi:hypothetical protein
MDWERYGPSIVAVAAILILLASTRGGLASLAPMARFVVPLVVIYFLFRWGFRRLQLVAANAMKRHMMRGVDELFRSASNQAGGRYQPGARRPPPEKVVDLCPKCGDQLTAGHRCG